MEADIKGAKAERIACIDVGKAVSIVLVFYYHIIEALLYKEFPYFLREFRFIASFIIPFFFFLGGLVVKEQLPSFKTYFIKSFNALLVPMVFFNLLALIILILVKYFWADLLIKELSGTIALKLLVLFFGAIPFFNGTTWFLTCLFTTQILYYMVAPYTKRTLHIIFSMVLFSAVSYLSVPLFSIDMVVMKFMKFFLFLPTALCSVVFYQFGVLVVRTKLLQRMIDAKLKYLWLIVFGVIIVMTYDMNIKAYSGPFKIELMNYLNFGYYTVFYFTGFVGIVFAMYFCIILKPYRMIRIYGENTLVLLGLNGIFYHFINPSIAEFLFKYCSGFNYWACLAIVFLITILQMAACYPFFGVINRFLKYLNELVKTLYFKILPG